MTVSKEVFEIRMATIEGLINDLSHTNGVLLAKNMILEARLAALAAFAVAVIKDLPNRDVVFTRWGKHLGPALQMFSTLGEDEQKSASLLPAWVATEVQENR